MPPLRPAARARARDLSVSKLNRTAPPRPKPPARTPPSPAAAPARRTAATTSGGRRTSRPRSAPAVDRGRVAAPPSSTPRLAPRPSTPLAASPTPRAACYRTAARGSAARRARAWTTPHRAMARARARVVVVVVVVAPSPVISSFERRTFGRKKSNMPRARSLARGARAARCSPPRARAFASTPSASASERVRARQSAADDAGGNDEDIFVVGRKETRHVLQRTELVSSASRVVSASFGAAAAAAARARPHLPRSSTPRTPSRVHRIAPPPPHSSSSSSGTSTTTFPVVPPL